MNQAQLRAPWEYCKAVLCFAPVTSNAQQNGAGVDRTGYDSLIADVPFAVSGAPTGGTVTLQLQDSADDATFANFGPSVVAQVGTGAASIASLALDVRGARQFVRVTAVSAPTGGNAPVASLAGTLRLFGPDALPAA